ncbi:hypothetical protein OsI_26333 [Oryza sativa Indica Group]|uniref:Uncharacterized protein n=1 Tax=Oryza sativa subsp. indica TaxID=39946 RepID=B8B6Y9_ORYSI|nr:hypothetical protein OsI_26333 [Oryza sativa Indica Group]
MATAASSLSRCTPRPCCSLPCRPQGTSPSASPSRVLAPPAAVGMRWGKGGEGLPPWRRRRPHFPIALTSPLLVAVAAPGHLAVGIPIPRHGSSGCGGDEVGEGRRGPPPIATGNMMTMTSSLFRLCCSSLRHPQALGHLAVTIPI